MFCVMLEVPAEGLLVTPPSIVTVLVGGAPIPMPPKRSTQPDRWARPRPSGRGKAKG